MSQRKQRRFVFVLLPVLLGVGALLVVTGVGSRRQLPSIWKGATVVAKFPKNSSGGGYTWMPDGDLLVIIREATGFVPVRIKPRGGIVARYAAVDSPMSVSSWGAVSVSPTRPELLAVTRDVNGFAPRLRHRALRQLKGPAPKSVAPDWEKAASRRGYDMPAWAPGGDRWVQIDGTASGWELRRFAVSDPNRPVRSRLIPGTGDPPRLLGVAPNGDAVLTRSVFQAAGSTQSVPRSVEILRIPEAPVAPVTRVSLPAPGGSQIFHPLALSPDGRKLLWANVYVDDPLQRLLLRLRRSLPQATMFRSPAKFYRVVVCSRVSDIDGRNARDYAYDEITPQRYTPSLSLRWTPDSRHVSFVEDGNLYLRPVP